MSLKHILTWLLSICNNFHFRAKNFSELEANEFLSEVSGINYSRTFFLDVSVVLVLCITKLKAKEKKAFLKASGL